MPMNRYIQLVQEGLEGVEANWKKLRVLFAPDTPYPFVTVQGETAERTVSGKLSLQLGPSYILMKGTLKVNHTEDPAYASVDDLRPWMTSTDPTKRNLILRPFNYTGVSPYNVTYKVAFVGGEHAPLPQVAYIESAGGFYYIPFQLEQR
jgi:hypothetical protein